MALQLQVTDPQDRSSTIDAYIRLRSYEVDRDRKSGEIRFDVWKSKSVKDRDDGSKTMGRVFPIAIGTEELAVQGGVLSQLRYRDIVSQSGEISFRKVYDKIKTHNIKWQRETLNLTNSQDV